MIKPALTFYNIYIYISKGFAVSTNFNVAQQHIYSRENVMEETVYEPSQQKCEIISDSELILLEEQITHQCLCSVSDTTMKKLFYFLSQVDGPTIGLIISTMQALCDLYMHQSYIGKLCPRISDIGHTFQALDNRLVDFLLQYNEETVLQASSCLTSVLIIMNNDVNEKWLHELTSNICNLQPNHLPALFSLDVIRKIMEWKGYSKNTKSLFPLKPAAVSNCCQLVKEPVQFRSHDLKYLCLKYLRLNWTSITSKFHQTLKSSWSSDMSTTPMICGQFFRLWKTLVSVQTNLSFHETQFFYDHMKLFVQLLCSGANASTWSFILDLYNEALCYGNTLSLQGKLDEKSCKLAHSIVCSVHEGHLIQSFIDRIAGLGLEEVNVELLPKFVLLVFKSVAVVVKNSVTQEVHDDLEVQIMWTMISGTISKLDQCVKSVKTCEPIPATCPLSEWIVQLFSDQSSYLIESMLCCLDVTSSLLCQPENVHHDQLHKTLNPVLTFLHFLHCANLNVPLLLEYLISHETCFLAYFFRILIFMTENFSEFNKVSNRYQSRRVYNLLNDLRIAIERLEQDELFPYDIGPVIILLKQCEQKYTALFIISRENID